MKIKPLGDRVVVEPVADDGSKKGKKSLIIIPATAEKERPERGVIIAVGEGKVTDEGRLIPLKVKKGQTVLFSKYGPDEVKIDGKEYFILSESNILAIIED